MSSNFHIGDNGEQYIFNPNSEAGDPVERYPNTEEEETESNPSENLESHRQQNSDDKVLFENGEVVQ